MQYYSESYTINLENHFAILTIPNCSLFASVEMPRQNIRLGRHIRLSDGTYTERYNKYIARTSSWTRIFILSTGYRTENVFEYCVFPA